MSGEITKPSETTVTEEMSDEPVHVEALGTTDIYAPGGQTIPLSSELPDQVFAGKMMGDGVDFIPERWNCSTVWWYSENNLPTKHAIGLESESGVEVLIHIGIDTVKLERRRIRKSD